MTSLDSVFDEFVQLTFNRLQSKVYTTEDSIRYLFFHSLVKKMIFDPNKLVLECPHPHPELLKKKIDTVVMPFEDNPGMAFEFKFDRIPPSETNQPKPQKAGSLFKDIFRLAMYKQVKNQSRCFFIYITDFEMIKYFENQSNNLENFFSLEPLEFLEIDEKYIKQNSETLVKSCSKIIDCKIQNHLKKDQGNFAARIFEVL